MTAATEHEVSDNNPWAVGTVRKAFKEGSEDGATPTGVGQIIALRKLEISRAAAVELRAVPALV